MNPFVKYTLAVAMGAVPAVQASAEEAANADQASESAAEELTTEQKAAIENFSQALNSAIESGKSDDQIAELIAEAVSKYPELTSIIQELSSAMEISGDLIAAAIIQGLPTTAAGNETPVQFRAPTIVARSGGGGTSTASGG